MPFIKTAMTSAIFKPLCPAIAPPATTSKTLSRIRSAPVRRIFMSAPYSYSYLRKRQRQNFSLEATTGCVKRSTCVQLAASRRGGLRGSNSLETQRVLLRIPVHTHGLARQNLAFQDLQRQWILQHALNRAPQRAGTKCRVVAFAEEQFFGRGRQLEREAPF